jgi:hypothetical protein
VREIVTKEEFDAFIENYPIPLHSSVIGYCEPPLLVFWEKDDTRDNKTVPDFVATVVLTESYPKNGRVPYVWAPNEYRIEAG